VRFHRESRRESYDVVVVGSGLGGLCAAALLAREGQSVLVVERHDRVGGYAHAFKRRRHLFDSAVHLIGGCRPGEGERAGVVERLLRALDVRDRLDLVRVDPFYSAIFPGFRLDVPQGLEAFAEAHVRRFPNEEKGFGELLQVCLDLREETLRVPDLFSLSDFARMSKHVPNLMRYHRATLASVMDDYLDDDQLKAVFATLWPYLGLPPSRVSFLYWAQMLMSYVEEGAWYCRGSFQALANALAGALRAHGGELLLESQVRRIRVEDGAVRGVVLENGQRIDAPVVVSNADAVQTFEELVGWERLPSPFRKSVLRMRPSISAFIVYAATRMDMRAAGATHEMFFYPGWDHDQDYRDLLRRRVSRLGVTVPTLTDPSLAPPGEHGVVATVLLPYEVSEPGLSWRTEKDATTEAILDELEARFPGFRDALVFAEGSSPRTLERYTRNLGGAMYGWEMSPGQVGPMRLGHATPVKGLVLAGHWTQPGGGVYGVVASGFQAAQRVLGYPNERDFWGALERRSA
jgi:phytoene desaturase